MQRTFLFAARRSAPAIRYFSNTATRAAINKIYPSAQEAIKDMKSDTTVLVGGFGFSGVPNTLINAVRDRSDLKNFTVVSNNAGMPGVGLGQWLDTKQIGKMIASYIGDNKTFEQMYLKGQLALELTPQGTIAEKCAAGAAGVPAFYTPAAYGTIGTTTLITQRIGVVNANRLLQYKPASFPFSTIQMERSQKWRLQKRRANSTAKHT
jgi:3-oxoacid CoA-transferase